MLTPHQRLVPALALLASVALTASCAANARLKDNGDTIVVQEQQEPDKMNPVISDMMATVDATAPILEGLVNTDEKMRMYPQLAAKVPSVENGLVKYEGKGMAVTYPLRHNVKWHDGVPFTSEDCKFTWQVFMNPKTMVTSKTGWDQITAVDTPDPYTVVAHFKTIYAPFAIGVFSTILPKHILGKDLVDPNGDSINKDDFNQHPIGTGPFKFREWVSGDHITMDRNDDYYLGKPHVKTIVLRIVPDENAAFTLLKSGELDVYQSASISQYEALKKLPNVVVTPDAGLTYEHIDFNLTKPYFKDVRVRQAIAYAINRKQISDKIYEGLYAVAYCDQSPMSWAYPKSMEGLFPYDPDKAKQLLDEAGWKVGPDGIRVKDGKRFSIKICSTAGRKPREMTELVLRYYLKQVGIELTIENEPGSTLFAEYPEGTLKGAKYDLALYALTSAPDPDSDYSIWHSSQIAGPGNNGQNCTHYSNPVVDKLLVDGERVLEQDKRQAIYYKMEDIITRDMPEVPLLYWATLNPHSKRLKNFKANPANAGNLWNTWEWEIADDASDKH